MPGDLEQINLRGIVNVVGRESKIINSQRGYFNEIIVPKTFEDALKYQTDVELLLNHDRNRKLGSIKDGNLKLLEDDIGLIAKCLITDKEVIRKYKSKKLIGWSFGFVPIKDRWEQTKDNIQKRYIEEIYLTEVSILDDSRSPAYYGTTINEENIERRILIINEFNDNQYSLYEREVEFLKLKGGK